MKLAELLGSKFDLDESTDGKTDVLKILKSFGFKKTISEKRQGSTRTWFNWPANSDEDALSKALTNAGLEFNDILKTWQSKDYDVRLDNGNYQGHKQACIAKFAANKFGDISRRRRDYGYDF
jgi:hypothetical protein